MKNTETKETEEPAAEIIPLDIERVLRLVESIESDVRSLRHLLSTAGVAITPLSPSYIAPGEGGVLPEIDPDATVSPVGFMHGAQRVTNEDEAIEGIFDGERMLDAQGKSYQVPPNYASKSKLIEGDPLKLYITKDGKYLYKQLGPIERRTIPGTLRMEGNHYVVDTDEGTTYNILTACVTYYMSLYNLKAGDRVMIMVPSERPAKWAVIDNLI